MACSEKSIVGWMAYGVYCLLNWKTGRDVRILLNSIVNPAQSPQLTIHSPWCCSSQQSAVVPLTLNPDLVCFLFSTGWGPPNARDYEAGTQVSAEFLCWQPTEPSSSAQAHQPFPQSRGKYSPWNLAGSLLELAILSWCGPENLSWWLCGFCIILFVS